MANDVDNYDFSNYPEDHPLYSEDNKKVIGKFKDERSESNQRICRSQMKSR